MILDSKPLFYVKLFADDCLKMFKTKIEFFFDPFPWPPPMKHLVLFDLIIFCDIVKMLFLICNNDISFPAKMVYNNIAEWVDLFFPYLPLSATIHEGWSVRTILYIEQSCQYYFKFNAHISSVCEKMIKKIYIVELIKICIFSSTLNMQPHIRPPTYINNP